ncbi:MAG: anti-sigma F factor [Oscillospiraceae bacterium]|nr:anti-sigma F factor [Oscillospiraceae bacterium]
MKAIDQVSITFTSRSANEGFARAAAACFAAQLDPTLDEVADIKTAVSEAVTNAIVHAYPDCLGKIVLRLRLLDGGMLEIQVKDSGVGIPDVDQARTPLFTTGGEERSGMGFTIMESFMDGLRVRSQPGRGTTVTMRKRLAPRAGGHR